MFSLIRALTYAALLVAAVLAVLPGRVLATWGIARPAAVQVPQVLGLGVGVGGAALALWCAVTFAFVGKGTPIPFDPPRQLVVRGPYRFVRNPMAIGVALALAGAAMYYESGSLVAFTGLFLLVIHLMVVGYEEPTLRRMFGEEYEAYTRRVRRWWPRIPPRPAGGSSNPMAVSREDHPRGPSA